MGGKMCMDINIRYILNFTGIETSSFRKINISTLLTYKSDIFKLKAYNHISFKSYELCKSF